MSTVERTPSLDLPGLLRRCRQRGGFLSTASYRARFEGLPVGRLSANAEIEVNAADLRGSVLLTPSGEGSVRWELRIPLEARPMHLGGLRWWARCPNTRCGRRCAAIFLRWPEVGCRRCLGLRYASNDLDPLARRFAAVDRARAKLGMPPKGWGRDIPFPPPRMHSSTYRRLRAELDTATDRANLAVLASLGGLGARLSAAKRREAREPSCVDRPLCGARTRAGNSCRRKVAVVSGEARKRCRNHGGLSTGPRTAEGRARIAESNRRRRKHQKLAL